MIPQNILYFYLPKSTLIVYFYNSDYSTLEVYRQGGLFYILNNNNFANILHELRSKHNLSMSELASILGFKTKSAINQFEKSASLPSFHTLLKMANFFCVSLDYLTGRSNEPEYEEFIPPAEEAFFNHPTTSQDLIDKYKQNKATHPIELVPVLLRNYEIIRDGHD